MKKSITKLLVMILLVSPFITQLPVNVYAAEAGSGAVYSVVELTFSGPNYTATGTPAKDVDFWVQFQHESGSPTYKIHGFWDGDGNGGTSGNVFRVRFCPTKTGRWNLVDVYSNKTELNDEKQGDYVTATSSSNKGFWEVDTSSPGNRWYKRSDGSHQYIFGNTHYTFLSETKDNGQPNGSDIATDIIRNKDYFKKLRFSIVGDRYPNATDKPFLNSSGVGSNNGDDSHRPNPKWFKNRVDVAVKTGFTYDLITDIILGGPDTDDGRSTLAAANNGGDNTPFLKYIAARYGAYPNVWICMMNEFDAKVPSYSTSQIITYGNRIKNFLAYPVPISVHTYGNDGWKPELNSSPSWNDHVITQHKMKDLSDAADDLITNYSKGGSNKPTINDEVAYEGAGDGWTEQDGIEAMLGTFLGGGYGTTAYKPANKKGQYFWGNFSATAHTGADNLKWISDQINANITFWNMEPVALASSIFTNTDAGFRALQWSNNEYVLGTDSAKTGVEAILPSGTWTIKSYDAIGKTTATLSTSASGTYIFNTSSSRAMLYHFKRNEPAPTPTPTPTPTPPPSLTVYQAEDAPILSGVTVETTNAGYTGTGYADYGGNGTYVEWNNINIDTAGEYTLAFRYAAKTNRQCDLRINGVSVGNLAFSSTGSWSNWQVETKVVTLNQGINTIRITANKAAGGPNLDKMERE